MRLPHLLPAAPTVVALSLLATLSPTAASAAGPAATRATLGASMAAAGAGSGAMVVDLDSGRSLYARRADVARPPASVEKLYTSATALVRYGPQATFSTDVLAAGPIAGETLDGNLILRGGGDPTLTGADLDALVAAVRAAGIRRIDGRVVGDESRMDKQRGGPASGMRTSSYVGPLGALVVSAGRTGVRSPYFQVSPGLFAAQALTARLKAAGVRVRGAARTGITPPSAAPLAGVPSPTVADIATAMNVPSDNFLAETLVKDVGADFGGAGTTAAGAAVVRSTVAAFGAHPTVVDGSGLSRADRTSPRDLTRLLRAMWPARDALGAQTGAPQEGAAQVAPEVSAAFRASLAVVGRTGTVRARMRGTVAQDRCRAKTGTLTGVSALAGVCVTAAGQRIGFAFLMTGVSTAGAHRLQDRMTAAVAGLTPAAVQVRVRR